MRLKLYILSFLFLIAGGVPAGASISENYRFPTQELKELNSAISKSNFYEQNLSARINHLKDSINKISSADQIGKIPILLRISELYNAVNTDSSVYYSHLAKAVATSINDHDYMLRSDISMVNSLSTAGLFSMAINTLDSIKNKPMAIEDKISMWKAGRQLYSYMMSYLTDKSQFYNLYRSIYLSYDDSLLQNMPKSDDLYQFIYGERLVTEGRYSEAKNTLNKLVSTLPINNNLYGRSAYQLALISRSEGDDMNYGRLLALAARSDVEACVKEGLALPALARWLYEKDRLDEAFHFINFALEDAMEGNARMRAVTIAMMVPIIDGAYSEQVSSARDRLILFFAVLTVLLLLTLTLLIIILRQKKQGDKIRLELSEMTKRQNSYIGNFLGMCSTYAEKLSSLNKLVSVKVASGQTDDLLRVIKSKYSDSDEDIYSIFDQFFLDIYPGFSDEINSLLREDEKIVLKNDEGLSPELRIYALVRLGIDESTRIASILHYSVSTIYAYRNRMRNKAINRDTFDHDVMNFGHQNF